MSVIEYQNYQDGNWNSQARSRSYSISIWYSFKERTLFYNVKIAQMNISWNISPALGFDVTCNLGGGSSAFFEACCKAYLVFIVNMNGVLFSEIKKSSLMTNILPVLTRLWSIIMALIIKNVP